MGENVTRIQDKATLNKLLQIVAEESVIVAKEHLYDRHADLEHLKQADLAKRIGDFKAVSEEEPEVDADKTETEAGEEEPDAGGEKPKATAKEPDAEDGESGDDEPDDGSDAEGDEDSEKITFGMIRDKLNTIRGGKSLKDDEIRSEIKTYIAGLSDAEKTAMHTFLSAIAGILTSGMEGEQAPDPSDPPNDVTMTKREKPKRDNPEPEAAPERSARPARRHASPSGEDTTPPIQVGKQRTESLRLKVRGLMRG